MNADARAMKADARAMKALGRGVLLVVLQQHACHHYALKLCLSYAMPELLYVSPCFLFSSLACSVFNAKVGRPVIPFYLRRGQPKANLTPPSPSLERVLAHAVVLLSSFLSQKKKRTTLNGPKSSLRRYRR